jgi:hypothetical protein
MAIFDWSMRNYAEIANNSLTFQQKNAYECRCIPDFVNVYILKHGTFFRREELFLVLVTTLQNAVFDMLRYVQVKTMCIVVLK